MGIKAKPIQRTILQIVGNALFDSRWEIFQIIISEPGSLELADTEAELFNHLLEANDTQLHICVSEVGWPDSRFDMT